MGRLFALIWAGLLAFAVAESAVAQEPEPPVGQSSGPGVFATNDGGVFGVRVEEMVFWINRKQDVEATPGALSHWDNNVNRDATDIESVAILRLVLNRDVRVIGLAEPLKHPTVPGSTLATFVSFETDGDGQDESLEDGTGDPATGFPESEYGADKGVGPGNFVYIGGGSTSAGTTGSNLWATPERMDELTSVAIASGETGEGSRYSLGELLQGGAFIRHVERDGAVLITVRVQGRSGEDFGPDSDDTEAPDVAADAPYTATVQLTALP